MLIYRIINSANNKFYIGKTIGSAKTRFNQHKYMAKIGKPSHLYNAIRKWGTEYFSVEVIEDNIISVEVLNQQEIYYISTLSPHYNMDKGGTGGCHLNEQQLQELSLKTTERNKNMKGKTFVDIYGKEKATQIKSAISEANRGRKLNLSEEERRNRSLRLKINNPNQCKTQHSIEKMKTTFKERKINIGNKNGMKTHPESKLVIATKNSKMHHLRNIKTGEEIFVRNLADWSRNNNVKPSTSSVYMMKGIPVNGWIRLNSFPQPSS